MSTERIATPEPAPLEAQRYLLLTCAVLARECYHCAARSKNLVEVRLVEQGLHDIGEAGMSAALQKLLDAAGPCDAILLGYGLCNNGIRGLRSRVPLVVPRAHDCITLLLGSKERYDAYFKANPGTYFQSTGWVEHAKTHLANPESTTRGMGLKTYEEYVEAYGEEDAKYLMETLGNDLKNYHKVAFIDMGVTDPAAHLERSRQNVRLREHTLDLVKGDLGLLQRMVDGQWDEREFLVLKPGQTIQPDPLGGIVKAGPG